LRKSNLPVDVDHLDRYTGGDRAINEEILLLFDTQCREMLAQLDHLTGGEGDPKSWRAITHTLKGAALGIGAFDLGDAAAEAENAAAKREAALAALLRLREDAAAVYDFIEKFLANTP